MGESATNCSPGRETYGIRFASDRGALSGRDDDILLSPISSGVQWEGGQLTTRCV